MAGADGMSSKFMKSAFVGWTMSAGLYYPPDFDHTKLMPLKMLRPKGVDANVKNMRMMFPFTMICDACHEYNYTGTKFTAKVEEIKTESYLGLRVYRFYGRCRHCWAEFTFKTDPKNSDYTMESGGKRTYEAWKDADMMESQLKAEKEKEREQDQMKALEQKAVDVQSELQRTEDLDSIMRMNKRLGHRDLTIQEALDTIFTKAEKQAAEEQELLPGEEGDMDSFREDVEEQRRRRLDEEVEGAAPSPAADDVLRGSASGTGTGSRGSKSDAAVSSSAASAGSSSTTSAAVAAATAAASKVAAAAGATSSAVNSAVVAAIAERTAAAAANKSSVGAKFAVKRKAPVASEPAEPEGKRPCVFTTGASVPAAPAGGIGLGSYDSDSS